MSGSALDMSAPVAQSMMTLSLHPCLTGECEFVLIPRIFATQRYEHFGFILDIRLATMALVDARHMAVVLWTVVQRVAAHRYALICTIFVPADR